MNDTLKANDIADTFATLLLAEIGPKQFRSVIFRNRTPEYSDCCASGDFCDSNMVMADAVAQHGFSTEGDFLRGSNPTRKAWIAAWNLFHATCSTDRYLKLPKVLP